MRLPRRTILSSLLFALAAPAFAQAPGPLSRTSEAEALAALKAELETRATAERFWGAVLVARAGQPVFLHGYGYADRDKMIANTPETKFRYGSMAKMFTAVAVGQLAEAGKLSFEAPVSTYLPDYPNKEIAAVTVHQLLTHTAGTGDIFGPMPGGNRPRMSELKDYVAAFGDRGPKFPPGSRYEYSNYGMILAGRIIETVSGQSYFDYVRERIFTPAGMTATDARLSNETPIAGLALPYTRLRPGQPPRPPAPNEPPSTEPLRVSGGMPGGSGTSAGGGYSTVGDFLRFATALTSHKLLSGRMTEIVTTGKVDMGPPGGPARMKYAYGFGEGLTPDGVRHFGHNGGTPGVNGNLTIYPKSGYVVVALANLDPPAADSAVRFIEPRLPLA
jgi:CubicO group peptidase (beta-lactamase class C family)